MSAFARPNVRQAALFVAGSALLLAPFLVYVWGHVQIVTTGYTVDSTETRIQALEQENRALRLARARLLALPRIEERAAKLGLERVDLARMVVLSDRAAAPAQVLPPLPAAAASPAGRDTP